MKGRFPFILPTAQAYQWLEGDAWRVGTKATLIDGSPILDFVDKYRDDDSDWPEQSQVCLMRWSHTGELEWVEESRLMPYPPDGKPIPEPTK
jgi:hypothetical protein